MVKDIAIVNQYNGCFKTKTNNDTFFPFKVFGLSPSTKEKTENKKTVLLYQNQGLIKILNQKRTSALVQFKGDEIKEKILVEIGISNETKIEEMLHTEQRTCFDKNWISLLNHPNQINDFVCLICKQVANNPVEISCQQHQNLDGSLIIGEHCLKQFLAANPNSCPVQPHEHCEYTKIRLAQRQIGELKVKCPRQFAQELQALNQGHEKKTDVMKCNFSGKLKEINEHLNNTCSLKLIDCWFKPFGCGYHSNKLSIDEHMISKGQVHIELVMKAFETLKQTLELLQEGIKQLQSQNEKLKLEVQLTKKKDKDDLMLLKQTSVLKIKKKSKNNAEPIQKQENENQQTEELVHKYLQTIQAKDNQLLEKENEIKKIQTKGQQELLKLRAEIENVKRDFAEKEKQILSHHEKELNELKEKNHKLTLEFEKLVQYNNLNKRNYVPLNFDLFRSANPLKRFFGHTKAVYSVDYLQVDNGKFLCSGSDDYTVRVWDVDTAKQLKIFNGHSNFVNCVKFSPYHQHTYHRSISCSASSDQTIRFWDFDSDRQIQLFNGHEKGVSSIQFSPFSGGRYLCSGSFDNTIRLWDVETSKSLQVLKGHTHSIWCVDISPSQSNNNAKDNKNASAGVIGGTGYTICSGCQDNTIYLWDIETAKRLIVFNGHENVVRDVKYSPYGSGINGGGNTICSASDDKTIRLWDIRSKKEIQVFKGHKQAIWAVEYPPFVIASRDKIAVSNANIICSGSGDKTIYFWDVRTAKQLHGIKGNDLDGGILCLRIPLIESKVKRNDDYDNILCYGSNNGTICMWG
ncbi:G-protein beta WD-40 repeats containing protein [Reticulomyxa filosa]|uniref:G-protein beta WD-40 repeats containing protein n=1 Tax=Reticulomyxa filosa TaxID=46433 RepID=X6M446_RETFI|nr:G-protein beta WD-40 repeats containing protein [Reticulomyxa filosa]|eukprot:ETO07805.1 G-protein beta WD-40 repeats containing protein [Reticulomyxa filosa]